RQPATPELLDLTQVRGHGLLAEAGEAAARVGGEEQDDPDARLRRGLGRCERLVEAEVVKLADGGVPGVAELAIDERVLLPNGFRRLPLRLGEHQVAPRPEVPAAAASAQSALEGVAMRIDEARHAERLGHAENRHSFDTHARGFPGYRRSRGWRAQAPPSNWVGVRGQ